MSTTARTLHLVDVENLMGADHERIEITVPSVLAYLLAVRWRRGDHVVLAGQPGHVLALGLGLPVPHLCLVAYPGADGADRRLTDHDTAEHIGERFDRLALGSGDHHFVPMARRVRALGVEVVVAHRPGSLHHELATAASRSVPVAPVPVLDLRDRPDTPGPAPVVPARRALRHPGARPARRRPRARP